MSDEIIKNSGLHPFLRRVCGGEDVTATGAFRCGELVCFNMSVPRVLGASGVVMRINRDGQSDTDIPLTFLSTDAVFDVYTLTLDTGEICKDDSYGLFYYEFLFLRGYNTVFSDSVNNVDFVLSERDGFRFRMLVYQKDYTVPEWFCGGVIYHVFVDRFCRGVGDVSLHGDQKYNDDWEGGVPEYADIPGGEVRNNVLFGGNLWGVAEKLDYLASLGVSVIYLSPVFEAHSNHKYDTGDYTRVDSAFGGDEALKELIQKAAARGIRLFLDGVFNHTGDDSRYFNKYGTYNETGAYQSPESRYYNWYSFKEDRDSYESWWGIPILPKLNQNNPDCRDYFAGENGIGEKYAKMGIGGWRLDVADELCDGFLDEFRENVKKASDGQAVILGEVWENASDKTAYGKRRRYLSGRQLDSVMNYPLRSGILAFLIYNDAETLYNMLTEIYASYPRMVSDRLMNLLGTHDTERIITLLGSYGEASNLTNEEAAGFSLSPEKLAEAVRLMKIASVIQYTVYGIPSVYYGDEVGLEGGRDPFCRMPFPWSRLGQSHRAELLEHYRRLGKIRAEEKVFNGGDFVITAHTETSITYERRRDGETVIICANMGDTPVEIRYSGECTDLITGEKYSGRAQAGMRTALILKKGG